MCGVWSASKSSALGLQINRTKSQRKLDVVD